MRDVAGLRRALLAWYRRERRDMPWRETRDPYRIWVSEIMLQQTQVVTATPYYLRFVERFPDVAALARAPLDRVLAAWAGLGYYRRARLLHEAARVVVREHAGRVPDEAEAFGALPGVGRYTMVATCRSRARRAAAACSPWCCRARSPRPRRSPPPTTTRTSPRPPEASSAVVDVRTLL